MRTPSGIPTTAAPELRRTGYLVLPDLLSPKQLSDARAEALAICRGERGDLPGAVPTAPDLDDAAALSRYLCIHFPHKLSALFLTLARHPGTIEPLTEVIGPNVKLVQSMLFLKATGKPGQAWHQDESHIPTRDRSLAAVWIALDDATVENGCLWVLPGSHGPGVLHPVRPQHDPAFDPTPEAFGFDDAAAVAVEVPAGSAVLFDGYLLHRSLPNAAATGTRRALVYHYMSAESLLPWHPPGPDETMATVDHRDVVLVAGRDPYPWKGTVAGEPPRLRTETHRPASP